MIRYTLEPGALDSEIGRDAPTWRKRAAARTAKIADAGRYHEKSSIWSEVKPAFMRLQHSKCAFCERKFEEPQYSAIEFDVEHFRPKGAVTAWPDPVRHAGLTYPFATGTGHGQGYFWLAYDTLNYAAACKVCNTILKLSSFPVAGARGGPPSTVTDLATELPLLCYPIGEIDDDPERLVTFEATTAVPASGSGHARDRGTVIIDFFELNLRDQLHRERAQWINFFATYLRAVTDGRASAMDTSVVARMDHPGLAHAGCVRAFKRLWARDRQLGERVARACEAFWASDGGTPPPTALAG